MAFIASHTLLIRLATVPVAVLFALLVAAAARPLGQHHRPRRAPRAMPGEVRHHATPQGTRRGEISRRSARWAATGMAVVRDEHPTSHAAGDDSPTVVIPRELVSA
jgi:hypothetical protein